MDVIFKYLTPEENDALVDAIPLITLLIGSADGIFEEEEKSWGQRVAKFRSYTYDKDLKLYYKVVYKTFDKRLNHFMRKTSKGGEARMQFITKKLSELNPILKKMNKSDASALYQGFKSFAKHVAKSTGGILYMGNVSPAEKELIELDMISPIDTYTGI